MSQLVLQSLELDNCIINFKDSVVSGCQLGPNTFHDKTNKFYMPLLLPRTEKDCQHQKIPKQGSTNYPGFDENNITPRLL